LTRNLVNFLAPWTKIVQKDSEFFKFFKFQLGQENPEVRRLQQLHTTESNVVKTDYLTLINRRNELSDGYNKLYEMYKEIQGEVLSQLIIWKREQQLAGNGHKLDMNQLEILQVESAT
jgi:hypothetical protein